MLVWFWVKYDFEIDCKITMRNEKIQITSVQNCWVRVQNCSSAVVLMLLSLYINNIALWICLDEKCRFLLL